MTVAGAPTEEQCKEAKSVFRHRYLEARDYGFTMLEARLYGESTVDAAELRRLRRLGCPPAVAFRVLL